MSFLPCLRSDEITSASEKLVNPAFHQRKTREREAGHEEVHTLSFSEKPATLETCMGVVSRISQSNLKRNIASLAAERDVLQRESEDLLEAEVHLEVRTYVCA
eukprot:GHVU01216402.1.p2 GENE.GHVU01216402.1~~GHVU01216402.1.p2  ORF type:complete len:103 (+),score=4.91 GHVU01216402.1:710-1018(+)